MTLSPNAHALLLCAFGPVLTAGEPITGGAYTLEGNFAAEPPAMSGGAYAIQGNFSHTLILQLEGLPNLRIQREGAFVVISWRDAVGDFELHECAALGESTAWTRSPAATEINNGQRRARIPIGPSDQFFRLQKALP